MSSADQQMFLFNGETKDWPIFSEKYLARARKLGFKDILTGKEKVPNDTEAQGLSTTRTADKPKLDSRAANEKAYEDLLLSIDGKTTKGKIAFRIVKGAKSTDFKDGNARQAWERLCKKYDSKSVTKRLMLRRKFEEMKLKSASKDPDLFITELEEIQSQLAETKSFLTDEQLLEHVLNNLPKEYDVVIAKVEDRLGATSNPLTIEELRDELSRRYERMRMKNRSSRNDSDSESEGNDEIGMFAGGFKGKCHNCGKQGHRSRDCKEKQGKKSGQKDKKEGYQSRKGSGDSRNKRFEGTCWYCKKGGHKAQACRKRLAEEGKSNETANNAIETSTRENDDEEVGMVSIGIKDDCACKCQDIAMKSVGSGNRNYFLADSGASCHMVHDDTKLYECVKIDDNIIIGNGERIQATKMGKLKVEVTLDDGKTRKIVLHNVKYAPQLKPFNLFSLTASMKKGFKLGSEGMAITLTKGDFTLKFDKPYHTKEGSVAGIDLRILDSQHEEMTKEVTPNQPEKKETVTMNVNTMHRVLGHTSEETTRATCKRAGIKLIGSFEICDACALAKARQRNLGHVSEERRSKRQGERLSFDVSSTKCKSLGGKQYWLLVIDEATSYCWSYFIKQKAMYLSKL